MGCYFNIYSFGDSYEHIFPVSLSIHFVFICPSCCTLSVCTEEGVFLQQKHKVQPEDHEEGSEKS